ASTSRRSSSTAPSSTSEAPTGPAPAWAPGAPAAATSSSASRARTTACSTGHKKCSTGSGAAALAKGASCATFVPRRSTGKVGNPAPCGQNGRAYLRTVARDGQSEGPEGIVDLVRETVDGLRTLIGDHIKLARVELATDLKTYGRSVGVLAAAGGV